jgi:hypothetical protein
MPTLASVVNPLPIHSFTSSGASIDVKLAFVTNGSDMILTVNPLVARMFSLVSFSFSRGWINETLIRGGLCETYSHSDGKVTHTGVRYTMEK